MKKRTPEEFEKIIYDLVGDEYIILESYVNSSTKVKMIHNKCNNIHYYNPINFLSKNNPTRCPYCSNKIKKTTESFKKEIFDKYNDEYTVLGEYINTDTKIEIQHNKCNRKYFVRPNRILNGNDKCPYCYGNNIKKSPDDFIKEVNIKTNGAYTVIGEYINNKTKIKIKHNKCGLIWETRPDNFLNNKNGCPRCKESKGEKFITNWLINHNYSFEKDAKFSNCKNIKELSFDYKLILNDTIILIEYDGIQHFIKSFYQTDEEFENQIKRDKIKNKFCAENNNIRLYRIPYSQYNNLDNILNNIFKEFK